MVSRFPQHFLYKQLSCWAVAVAATVLLLAVQDVRRQCKAPPQLPLQPPTMRLLRAEYATPEALTGSGGSTYVPSLLGSPVLELVGAWRRSSDSVCKGMQIVFVREFFVSEKQERSEEIAAAVRSSLMANPCGLHRLIVTNTTWLPKIEQLQKETAASIEVYHTKVMLMSRLFEVAATKSTLGGGPGTVFAASTADVALPWMDAVPHACSLAFKTKALLVMSRDDLHIEERNCEFYSAHGSFDVFMASADLVTPQVTLSALAVVSAHCNGGAVLLA